MHIFKKKCWLFESKNPIIIDRIILAFGLNPKDDLSFISIEDFIWMIGIFLHKNQSLDSLIEFCISVAFRLMSD